METDFSPIVSAIPPPREYVRRRRHPFNDHRRFRVWNLLSNRLVERVSSVIQDLSDSASESLQFYRFLRNKGVRLSELIHMSCKIEREGIIGRHLLVLGDSTSLNLQNHIGRIQYPEQIGVLEDNKSAGMMCHAHLAIDAQAKTILGLSDILLWNRPKAQGPKKGRLQLKLEQKESYKWLLGIENSTKVLQQACTRTFILDRDADIYESFPRILAQQGNHFVIRSQFDRQVSYQGQLQLMSHCLAQSECLGAYSIDLPGLDHYSSSSGKRVKRKARKATIEVRSVPVQVLPPQGNEAPILLYLVEANEIGLASNSPDKPVHWRLLTSHPVESLEQAMTIIHYYCMRWIIEQLFRTVKTEGFDLEATELETLPAIQKHTIMVFEAATKVLQLVYARDNKQAQPIQEVFDEQECTLLAMVNKKFEGPTEKQKNPYPKNKASWATWIIARLGGWKGYRSQKPPGPITIKKGLDRFYNFKEAMEILADSG
jgi:Transposase DDE domain